TTATQPYVQAHRGRCALGGAHATAGGVTRGHGSWASSWAASASSSASSPGLVAPRWTPKCSSVPSMLSRCRGTDIAARPSMFQVLVQGEQAHWTRSEERRGG